MTDFRQILFSEILRDAHRYAGGLEPARPTTAGRRSAGRLPPAPRAREGIRLGRDRLRDVIERSAARAGLSRRHFDPELAAARLGRIHELSDGLAHTYEQLADTASQRALIDLLKLRVLGPYHTSLHISPERYRAEQDRVDRELRVTADTIHVSDPWFSPLSLYRLNVDGAAISLHSHSVDIVSVFALGQYHHPAVHVSAGDVVLDVGGCWGDTALYFASRVGPHGRVYTIEFDPENLEVMQANLALNPQLASRIEVLEHALWDTPGRQLNYVQAGRSSTVLGDDGTKAGRRVHTVTLDELADGLGLQRLDFIKMDIEGAEPRALRGGNATIKRFGPKLALAAYHRDDDLVVLPRQVRALSAGYRMYLGSYSPVEDETVLFAAPSATSRSSST